MKTRSKATRTLRAMLARSNGFGASPNKQRPGLCGHGGIACRYYPEFGIKPVIPKVGLSRNLIFQPVSMLISFKKFGITFPPF